jgi:hypothetical protein
MNKIHFKFQLKLQPNNEVLLHADEINEHSSHC